ncbi:HTTM domain-containing protein [Flavobacteriaceae bacterium]|jgi:vitamin K-dependent gamma-carboxylase|nr:HTTM domain-containing protein [Flavobacteriaceae bacterium]
MLNHWLYRHIDNSALCVFRIFFGLLITLESFGAILTGWVKQTLVLPSFTFSFINFSWLQPLPGNGMYIYFVIMGVCGIAVMIGYRYRLSMIAFTVLWAGVYFMQKSSYNNHYYLLVLLNLFMCVLPANRYFSLDVKQNPSLLKNSMPNWCRLIIIVQLTIVYVYASLAKLYPDWLDTTVMEILMRNKKDYVLIGDLLQQHWIHTFLAYGGVLFDLLIIPLLLWKPTRKSSFYIAVGFHLFNSIVFQIGIFPYMSLALCVFFFDPKRIQQLFFRNKTYYNKSELVIPKYKSPTIFVLSLFFLIQIGLPLRHWFIKDNVLWTEEAHRLSWRMMLRSKYGVARYTVVDKKTQEKIIIKLDDYLTKKQKNLASSRPDIIWQFAQYLKNEFSLKDRDIAVYVDCRISVNGRPLKAFIDNTIDLASVQWEPLKHNTWILPSNQDYFTE